MRRGWCSNAVRGTYGVGLRNVSGLVGDFSLGMLDYVWGMIVESFSGVMFGLEIQLLRLLIPLFSESQGNKMLWLLILGELLVAHNS